MDVTVDVGANTMSLISQLASHIGVATTEVFPWYIHRSLIEGWVLLGVTIMMIIMTVITALIANYYFKTEKSKYDAYVFIYTIIAIVSLVISVIMTLTTSYDSIGRIMSPQSYAIHDIAKDINLLKNGM